MAIRTKCFYCTYCTSHIHQFTAIHTLVVETSIQAGWAIHTLITMHLQQWWELFDNCCVFVLLSQLARWIHSLDHLPGSRAALIGKACFSGWAELDLLKPDFPISGLECSVLDDHAAPKLELPPDVTFCLSVDSPLFNYYTTVSEWIPRHWGSESILPNLLDI